MLILETIAVAFSMFSAIPMPQFMWNEKNMRYQLCAFPLIGIVLGLLMWGVRSLAALWSIPKLLTGALCCVLPLLITGGIHLDGYADTHDALASHADFEKKQAIMKDPHIGSFAVIRLGIWFVLWFVLWTEMGSVKGLIWPGMFALSRILSALAVCNYPKAKNTGLAHMMAEQSDRRNNTIILCIELLLTAVWLIAVDPVTGSALLAAAAIVMLYYRWMSMKQFGGITGDLAGWFLTACELAMLMVLIALAVL